MMKDQIFKLGLEILREVRKKKKKKNKMKEKKYNKLFLCINYYII